MKRVAIRRVGVAPTAVHVGASSRDLATRERNGGVHCHPRVVVVVLVLVLMHHSRVGVAARGERPAVVQARPCRLARMHPLRLVVLRGAVARHQLLESFLKALAHVSERDHKDGPAVPAREQNLLHRPDVELVERGHDVANVQPWLTVVVGLVEHIVAKELENVAVAGLRPGSGLGLAVLGAFVDEVEFDQDAVHAVGLELLAEVLLQRVRVAVQFVHLRQQTARAQGENIVHGARALKGRCHERGEVLAVPRRDEIHRVLGVAQRLGAHAAEHQQDACHGGHILAHVILFWRALAAWLKDVHEAGAAEADAVSPREEDALERDAAAERDLLVMDSPQRGKELRRNGPQDILGQQVAGAARGDIV
mmetsp:Transcript_6620/g.21375  ORF Transcript_6620/g.21375 Transcript_6620/m.21375 type:complete len:365 (-) Transcript_6620:93-1187(-)